MYLWTYRSCNLEVTNLKKNRWFTDLNTQGCLQKNTILVNSFPHKRFEIRKKVRLGFVPVNIFSDT